MSVWMLTELGRSRHKEVLAESERMSLARALPQRAGPVRRVAAAALRAVGVRAVGLAERLAAT